MPQPIAIRSVTVRPMSNRVYAMLCIITEVQRTMTVEEAGAYDQRSFGSAYNRKWLEWTGKHFRTTRLAFEEKRMYEGTDVHRKVASLRLTHHFEHAAIILKMQKAAHAAAS